MIPPRVALADVIGRPYKVIPASQKLPEKDRARLERALKQAQHFIRGYPKTKHAQAA